MSILRSRGLYCFYFPNGKRYVGIVVSKNQTFESRFTKHLNLTNKGNRRALYNAIRCYGWDNIVKKILLVSDDKTFIKDMEVKLIASWKLNKNRHGKEALGYNLTDGGDGVTGHRHSDETKMKLSKAGKGRKMSKESVAKGVAKRIGHIVSDETRNKISQANKGNPYYKSKEFSEIQRVAHLGVKPSKQAILKREKTKLLKRMSGNLERIQHKVTGEIKEGLLTIMCKENNICYKNIKGRGHSKGWVLLDKNNKQQG